MFAWNRQGWKKGILVIVAAVSWMGLSAPAQAYGYGLTEVAAYTAHRVAASHGESNANESVAAPNFEAFPSDADWEVGYSSHVNDGERTALAVVLDAIRDAHQQILIAAYEFTSQDIADALIQAHNRGVAVYVIADNQENGGKSYSMVQPLANAGIPVRLARAYKVFHNKYMVIDGRSVETGSFNYTKGAVQYNAENALYVRNVPAMANHYGTIWQRLWVEAGQN